ncbi:ComEC/Rec2 family competence protein [bacterium]|nr:MAG: ComEC/Rec2 family competence protein [bacterium]
MPRSPFPPSATPSFSRAAASLLGALLLRPLLWSAACALLGVMLGGQLAHAWHDLAREQAPIWLLLPFLVVGVAVACYFRHSPWLSRVGVAVAFTTLFAAHTTRRLLPPHDDISRLFANQSPRDQPLRSSPARLVGIIGDYPQRSRWNTRFPLDVETVNGNMTPGRMWVSSAFTSRLEVGDRIELRTDVRPLSRPRNPGEREGFWAALGARCWCQSGPLLELNVLKPAAAYPLERRIQGIRRTLLARYEWLFAGDEDTLAKRPYPRQNAALLTAMVWGENGLRDPLPQQTRDDFRAAGLSHLLVSSGSQVTALAMALLLIGRTFRVRRAWLLLLVVPGLVAYALIAGAAPSIWRATAFGILGAICLGSGRDLDLLSMWSAALVGLLALDPTLAWDLSFQFTFAAVCGLIVVAPVLFRAIQPLNSGKLGQLAAMSLAAQAATWPLSLLHFGTASATGWGANFLAVPLAEILVFAGSIGLVIPWGEPLYRLTGAVSSLASSAAQPAGALVEDVFWPTSWVWACYAILAMATLPLADEWDELQTGAKQWLEKQRANLFGLGPKVIVAGLVVVALAVTVSSLWPSSHTLRVTVIDVGQGQCIVIQDPSGRAVLVDGGSLDGRERAEIGAAVIVPALQHLGVTRLDFVFLTSPDEDHCNGLRRVLREVAVGAFVDGPKAGETPNGALWDELGQAELLNLRREVERLGVPVVVPHVGQEFPLGEARLRILNPQLPLAGSQHDNSLAMRLEWGNRSILLSGDLEREGEQRLTRLGLPLNCDVLMLSQHGSSTSSSPDWLNASRAGAAIVSCGRFNRLNVPSASVLRELAVRKIPLFRTDMDGALTVECDQNRCSVTPQTP